MRQVIASILVGLVLMVRAASAQQAGDTAWVQIEAQPSLGAARDRAQYYASRLPDVHGFSLGGNWYGIVLGPYSRADADRLLNSYRAEGRIPLDSFISFTNSFGAGFWPDGQSAAAAATVPTSQAPAATETAAAETPQATAPDPVDETPAEARRSEQLLTADERKDLQIALQSVGFYNSTIDGAFGAGTRRSMADWQDARGYEETGVLTTRQRKELMDEYNAPLISVGMQRIQDPQAGIEMQMPTNVVRFSHYEPPFAHYDSTDSMGARLILISQPGDRATLYGLYDIMQTLEIVPLQGPRERGTDSFTLEGRGNGIVSYTQAALEGGHIKGFTLVWPLGDEARRDRVLSAMQASFTRTGAVLDPAAGADAQQHVDLVSGLEIRKPRLSRSGFYVDAKGTVVTSADAVKGCSRITIEHDYTATVVAENDALGLAVLRPSQALAPMSVGRLRPYSPRLQSEIAVSGYSYEGVLGAPTLTFGTLADVKGLKGEPELARLALTALPGDAGGPVIDAGGGIVGMLLPPAPGTQVLPDGVSFAVNADAIRSVLAGAGMQAADDADTLTLPPTDLTRLANGMTVLVSCWD